MFIYLLIAAELAILYTVFWYLYLREPKQARRIAAHNWGNYGRGPITTGGGKPHQTHQVRSFMLLGCEEMTLDLESNHYVPVDLSARHGWNKLELAKAIQRIDDALSEFNVKP